MQTTYLPRLGMGADSGRRELLEALGLAEEGRSVQPDTPGSIGLALVSGLDYCAGLCREHIRSDSSARLRWDPHLICTYISKMWYQRVGDLISRRPSVMVKNCHGQHMVIIDGLFSVSVWCVDYRRLSMRNRTGHAKAILAQDHRVEGCEPLRFWELAYRLNPSRVGLFDVRFQYRLNGNVKDPVFVDGLREDVYPGAGAISVPSAVPVSGSSRTMTATDSGPASDVYC